MLYDMHFPVITDHFFGHANLEPSKQPLLSVSTALSITYLFFLCSKSSSPSYYAETMVRVITVQVNQINTLVLCHENCLIYFDAKWYVYLFFLFHEKWDFSMKIPLDDL